MKYLIIPLILSILFYAACHKKEEKKSEELTIAEYNINNQDTTGLKGNTSFAQLATNLNEVIITGSDRIKLIPIYKVRPDAHRDPVEHSGDSYSHYTYNEGEYHYFMPGIDYLYGYNMINVAHYDVETGRLSYFFEQPVLVRTLYYPGTQKDSLNRKPIMRDYFLASVYDEDTNRDSLINKQDLRRFYHFDLLNTRKTLLLPSDYSVVSSTYDYKSDIMYIYARFDADKNGTSDPAEPISIFWFRLSEPTIVRKIM